MASGLCKSVLIFFGITMLWWPAMGAGDDQGARLAVSCHTLAIKKDGSLWAWGYNANGQLGVGDSTDRFSPQQVGAATNWVAVAAGLYHSLGIQADGTLYAWGYNLFWQLGRIDQTDRFTPTMVVAQPKWRSVAAGDQHSLGIATDGSLYYWGSGPGIGVNHPLGNNSDPLQTPTKVNADTDWVAIAAGRKHSLALKANGSLWAWGANDHYQLGVITTPTIPSFESSPTQLGLGNNGIVYMAVACGYYHTLALMTDGSLIAWGDNTYGQLGVGNTVPGMFLQRVGTDNNWVAVAAGQYHSLALKADGSLYAWGRNNGGQLGQGNTTQQNSPQLVGTGYVAVARGEGAYQVMAIKKNGSLWCWGSNWFGQLGLGDAGEGTPSGPDRLSPTQLFGAGIMMRGPGTPPLELLLQ
jgi:alpha-tubulin suppressor-like RCC1 family protein